MTDTTDTTDQIHDQDTLLDALADLAWDLDTHAMTTTQLRELYELAKNLSQAAQAELVIRRK
jgi:hypothetical protein